MPVATFRFKGGRNLVGSAQDGKNRVEEYPLVTLAIPTLNGSNYLRETLLSALAQDYPNLDILVSDNGSRDETVALVQSLVKDDKRVRLRRNDVTVPIHTHFTQCVENARGEFFIMLCDDDLIAPRFVTELVAVSSRRPDATVVIPSNETIDESGKVLQHFAQSEREVCDGPELVCYWLFGGRPKFFVNVTTLLLRTALVRQFGGYQGLGGGRNNDNLLFLQCAISGPVAFAKDARFSWRTYARSYGSSASAKQIADSHYQFVDHLRRDPATVKAMNALTPKQRRRIFKGVGRITALELLFHIRFQDHPMRWECIRAVTRYRWDLTFHLQVLSQSYIALRTAVGAVFPSLAVRR